MRGPIAWVRRIREALDVLEEGERMDAEAERHRLIRFVQSDEARQFRIASGVALCPVCQHGEMKLVFGAMDDREGT